MADHVSVTYYLRFRAMIMKAPAPACSAHKSRLVKVKNGVVSSTCTFVVAHSRVRRVEMAVALSAASRSSAAVRAPLHSRRLARQAGVSLVSTPLRIARPASAPLPFHASCPRLAVCASAAATASAETLSSQPGEAFPPLYLFFFPSLHRNGLATLPDKPSSPSCYRLLELESSS